MNKELRILSLERKIVNLNKQINKLEDKRDVLIEELFKLKEEEQ